MSEQPIQQMTQQDPTSTRLIISMAVAGFFSGLIIIGIYLATFDTIKENKARELKEAVFRVLPGVTQMSQHRLEKDRVVPYAGDPDENTLYAGFGENGDFIGYALTGAGPGFQDTIKVIYGYQPESDMGARLIGMWILDSRETPGLGDKIYKDAEFVGNFDALSIEPTIKVVKKGTKTKNSEVDAITGATISSKAVVRIINIANDKWLPHLPVNPPEAPPQTQTPTPSPTQEVQ
ncbi:MAG: FMN-binding protein [Gammaproteobacteria bacterium]|nr:FMN-binding protein [Gammaproteobacteria bacterium]MCW8983170.1 FMN-binding protein [Gammaproteobacteria bacterium]